MQTKQTISAFLCALMLVQPFLSPVYAEDFEEISESGESSAEAMEEMPETEAKEPDPAAGPAKSSETEPVQEKSAADQPAWQSEDWEVSFVNESAMASEEGISLEAADFSFLESAKLEGMPAPVKADYFSKGRPSLPGLKRKAEELERESSASAKRELEKIREQIRLLETGPVYRLYNIYSGEHFYTPDADENRELIRIGWQEEGIGWQAPVNDKSRPVFRLYNPNDGDHHYTMDPEERTALVGFGWIDEDTAWYSDPYEGSAVYRLYNPNAKAGAHHYTTDLNEYDMLARRGWIQEGVAFYTPRLDSFADVTKNGKTGIVWYDENGVMKTGSQVIEGKTYYFDPSTGFMLQNRVYKAPDAADYRVYGHDGQTVIGSAAIGGKRYGFAGPSGDLVRESKRVQPDGSLYVLNKDGSIKSESFSTGGVVFTPGADGSIQKVEHLQVPRYMQTDAQWAKEMFDDYNFAYLGCLPTTMTSVLNYFGKQSLLPLEVGRILEREGFMSGSLANRPVRPLGTVQGAIPWLAKEYNLAVADRLNLAQMKRVLMQGGLVAISVGRSRFTSGAFSHEILVYGYDHGRVHVHDPLSAGNCGIYPLEDIYNIRNLDQYGRASGGPIFGFSNPEAAVAL